MFLSPQILYANEGESKRDQEAAAEPAAHGERPSYISHKGHEFILTLYHFPSSCEACTRPLWHVFKPPPALECRRCHTKCHKDHLDRKEEVIVPCKGERYLPPPPSPSPLHRPVCFLVKGQVCNNWRF